MSKSVTAWLAVLFVVMGAVLVVMANRARVRSGSGDAEVDDDRPPRGSETNWLTEFELTERSGKRVATADLKGNVVVVSFFFSKCPGKCRQQNDMINSLVREFKSAPIRFASVTCDPANDDPEELRRYALGYNAPADRWLFLTGDMTYIRRIGSEMFGTAIHAQTHGSRMFLIDKEGQVVKNGDMAAAFNWETAEELKQLKTALRAAAEGKDLAAEKLLPAIAAPERPHSTEADEEPEEKSDAKAEAETANP